MTKTMIEFLQAKSTYGRQELYFTNELLNGHRPTSVEDLKKCSDKNIQKETIEII